MMSSYLRYLWYVIRHKWFVFLECCKLGIVWLGIIHDNSKLRPDEFIPYARFFYGCGESLDLAWLLHQRRNKHHWQAWVLRGDDGDTRLLEIPLRYRKEMLADWEGAGHALGKPGAASWYAANKNKMLLGPETRAWIEEHL